MAAGATTDKTKVAAAIAIKILTGLLLLVFLDNGASSAREMATQVRVAADVANIQSRRKAGPYGLRPSPLQPHPRRGPF
jgi:hypothetical protein